MVLSPFVWLPIGEATGLLNGFGVPACESPASEAPGGGSSGPLRPHAAKPSDAASAADQSETEKRAVEQTAQKTLS